MTSSIARDKDSEKALASLAVLNVNWHTNARSYLDSFVPFAVEAMGRSKAATVEDVQVCELVRSQFGISLPVEVIGNVLKRAEKQKLVKRAGDGEFELISSKRDGAPRLEAEHAALLREQADLELALVAYAMNRFNLAWSQPEASQALLAYVEDASARMLAAKYQGATPSDDFKSSEPQRLVVASFINTIWLTQPDRFNYLVNVAKGSFLATTLFFQNHFDAARKFRDTYLLLDTGIILAALGFEGAERESSARAWIDLARTQGARIAVYDRTLRESKGVLRSAMEALKAGKGWQGRPGSVLAHFHESGLTVGVVNSLIASVENALAKLHLEVLPLPAPSTRPDLQIDELEVERVLNEGDFPYVSQNALQHDSRVLAAIRAQREGRAQDRLEEARAIFITGNYRVVNAARKVLDLRQEPWPVAMHVNDLAVLLWIKDTSVFPDLPKKHLLAMCLTILRPSERTWTGYIDEIRALKSQGSIEDVDIALIAQRNEQDVASLVSEISSSGRIKLRRPLELLEEARELVKQPIRLEAEALTGQLQETRLAESTLRDELSRLTNARRVELERVANALVTAGLVAAATLFSLVVHWVVADVAGGSTVVAALSFALPVVAMLVPGPSRSIFNRVRDRVRNMLWARSGVGPTE